jgi:hypothetical protein
MARLKSHGLELLRVQHESAITDSDLITWQRITRTYHADGKTLQKRDVRFKPDSYHPEGELHSSGWKVKSILKKGVTQSDHVAHVIAKIKELGTATKWRIVSGGPAPVVLDMARIMEATQADENIGFCQECGAEAYGVEPDARGYRCESCGAMAVSGAEELLIGA